MERRSGIFANERLSLERSSRSITVMLVFGFFLVGLAWFLFVSGYWTVKDIQVEGIHGLTRGDVASTTFQVIDSGSWKPWSKRTIFFIQPAQLASQLQEAMFAENVTVEKKYPDILRLKIQERQRSVLVASNSQVLVVDTTGVVTAEADVQTHGSAAKRLSNAAVSLPTDLPLILVNLPEPATAGYQATGADTIKKLIRAYKALEDSHLTFRYLKMEQLDATRINVVSDQGYDIVMDLSEPLDTQVMTYKKFIQAKAKSLHINQYVDVRVPGTVFAL